MKFLIADDDGEDVELFHDALFEVSPDAELLVARNGEQALNAMRSDPPAVVFLDINMPVMSGWECLETMRNDKELRNIPAIIFTTSSSTSDMEIASRLGSSCFLTKPDRFSDLKTYIVEVTGALLENRMETLGENPRLRRKVLH
jgi:CheY-like chemotaxis protein